MTVESGYMDALARQIEDKIFREDRSLWNRIAKKPVALTTGGQQLAEELYSLARTGVFQIRCDEAIERGKCLADTNLKFIWCHPDDREELEARLAKAWKENLRRHRQRRCFGDPTKPFWRIERSRILNHFDILKL